MYRASHDTLAQTIERLEAELEELRALRATPRFRARTLCAVTATSVVTAILSATACAASHAGSAELRRQHHTLLHRYESARAGVVQTSHDLSIARTDLTQKARDLAHCEAASLRELPSLDE
jgi:hypothetical protein